MWRMMAVVLLSLAPCSQALAWGKEGHRAKILRANWPYIMINLSKNIFVSFWGIQKMQKGLSL